MFDIWRNMLVVRLCTLQGWIVRMWLWIVPVQLVFALPNFVTILVYDRRQMVQNSLANDQPDFVIKVQFACNPCE